jgi:hypothetical protein
MFKDAKSYAQVYGVCQRVGKPYLHDDLPLHLVQALQAFAKWVLYLIGLINPPTKHSKASYIMIRKDLLHDNG